jgi:branched-chain amino acid transport system permease protein
MPRLRKMNRDLVILLGMLVIFLLLPLGVGSDPYIMHLLILSLIWGALVVNWDLMMGFCGIYSFGQIALFVIGAYGSGMVTVHLGVSPWLGILIGGLTAGLFGFLLGLPSLKLTGLYVTILTFAFHEALNPVLNSEPGRAFGTGGQMGLLGIPPYEILGYTFSPVDKLPWYFTALVVSFVIFFVVYKIIHSHIGLAFTALHDAEPFAKSLGVDEYRYKLMAFTFSAFLTGMAGAFYASYSALMSTRLLGLDMFLILLFMVIVGGIGRFPGSVMAAPFVIFLNDALRPLGTWRLVTFGAIVILFVLFAPRGLRGLVDTAVSFFGRIFKRRLNQYKN